jgi:hypothetical protein
MHHRKWSLCCCVTRGIMWLLLLCCITVHVLYSHDTCAEMKESLSLLLHHTCWGTVRPPPRQSMDSLIAVQQCLEQIHHNIKSSFFVLTHKSVNSLLRVLYWTLKDVIKCTYQTYLGTVAKAVHGYCGVICGCNSNVLPSLFQLL